MISTIQFELIQSLIAEIGDTQQYPIIRIAGILVADEESLFRYWKGDKSALDTAYMQVAKMPTEESTKMVQDFFTPLTESLPVPADLAKRTRAKRNTDQTP